MSISRICSIFRYSFSVISADITRNNSVIDNITNVHVMNKLKLDDNNSNNISKDSSNGIRGIFNVLFLSLYDDPRTIFGHNQLKFYCMCCGKEHKKRKCPECGSMAVKVG